MYLIFIIMNQLFEVTSMYERDGGLHLVGEILVGCNVNTYFYASYCEISYDMYMAHDNNEGSIVCSDNGKYYRIDLMIHKSKNRLGVPGEYANNEIKMKNGVCRYYNHMGVTAYIILTGMIVASI